MSLAWALNCLDLFACSKFFLKLLTCKWYCTTRYVIFFHGNFSRFFPHWHFSTLFTSFKSFIHAFFEATFFPHFFPKVFRVNFSHSFRSLVFHIFPTLCFLIFSPFFLQIFFHIFSRYFPHFSLATFSTFFSHYFFHSFFTLFPCVIVFHTFPMLFFST